MSAGKRSNRSLITYGNWELGRSTQLATFRPRKLSRNEPNKKIGFMPWKPIDLSKGFTYATRAIRPNLWLAYFFRLPQVDPSFQPAPKLQTKTKFSQPKGHSRENHQFSRQPIPESPTNTTHLQGNPRDTSKFSSPSPRPPFPPPPEPPPPPNRPRLTRSGSVFSGSPRRTAGRRTSF